MPPNRSIIPTFFTRDSFFLFALLSLFCFIFSSVSFAATISGTVYSDEGVTTATSTVKLVVNGSTAYSTSTTSNGNYTLTSVTAPSNGTPMTVYLDNNGGITGAAVTRYGGSDITDLNIYQNYLIARHDDAGPLANSDINF